MARRKRQNNPIVLYDGSLDDGTGRILTTNRGKEKVNSLSSEEYWRRREADHRVATIHRSEGYAKEIQDIYYRMLRNSQTQIDAFYQRYADKEGVTMAEAKKAVSKLDIAAYSAKAKKYVEMARKGDRKAFSEQADAEMRLYNLTMKVNRLEMLKSEIGLELVSNFDDLQKYFDKTLTAETLREFEEQAGILGKTVSAPAKRAIAIVNDSYQHAKFSERIWSHQTALKLEIGRSLEQAIISGKSAKVLAGNISKIFDTSRQNTERLMVTEVRRCQTEATKESMIANRNEMYEFMAVGPHPCDVCQELNGKKFRVADMQPGVNAPPMHPYCHCATAPVWDEAKYQRWLESYKEHELDFTEWNKVKFYDTTKYWKNNMPQTTYGIRDSNSVTVNGTTYHVDYQNVVFDPSEAERSVAKSLVRSFGGNIDLLPRVVKPKGVSTADYEYNGERFDLKTITENGKKTIYNDLHKKKRQSSNFVLDMRGSSLTRDRRTARRCILVKMDKFCR